MTRFFSMPIRTQLFLMAFIVAIPAVGIVIYAGLEQRNDAINSAHTDTRKLADSIAAEQKILVAGVQQLTGALAQLPEIRNQDTARVQPVLSDVLNINPQLLNIFIADRTGRMWISAKPSKGSFSVADRRHFINARTTGRFSSGEYIVGRMLGKPTLSFSYPYKNLKGKFSGVIVVNIDLDHFRNHLLNAELPQGSSYIILDHRGVILSRGIDPAPYVGKQCNQEFFKRVQKGPEGISFVGEAVVTGDKRFISCRKLYLAGEEAPYAYIAAGIPVDAVVSIANRALLFKLALLAPFMLIAFYLAWFIGRRSIVDRISILRSASQRLAEGDLQARVSDLVEGGELGELGRSFDYMADALYQDICKRKHDEQTLHEQARLLEEEVAERQKAEEALRKTERFLRTIIDAEPECVKLIAFDGTLQMMNRAGLTMIGAVSLDQVKGESLYPLVTPEYRDAFIALTKAVFMGTPGRLEFEISGLNGEHLWLDTHAVPFCNEDGIIVSLLGITRDITERKLAEAALAEKQGQLAELNFTLERRIDETVAEMRTKDQLLIQQSRLAAMGEMINNIAHQWRQPLNNLGLIVQNLKFAFEAGEMTEEGMTAEVRMAMDTIMFMSHTIDDFRNYFRQDKEKRDFQINDKLKSTLDVVSGSLRNNNITMDIDVQNDVVAFGYHNEFSQVLLNILNNAKDVLTERPVADPCIRIRVFNEDSRAVVTIWDNGGGIDENVLPKIFDPYFSTKEQGKGTGIGLYMSKAIIEQNMNGSLTVRNIDDGAEFRIEI